MADKRQLIYTQIFEPTYLKMMQVHTDYLVSFHNFYTSSIIRKTPEIELFYKLRFYSIEYSAWRQDIKNFHITAKGLVETFPDSHERNAIRAFSRAIRAYFKAATISDNRHASWFSFFLWKFEENILKQRNPFDFDYGKFISGVDPLKEFLELLELMYTKDIPARWVSVTKSKARLSALFNA